MAKEKKMDRMNADVYNYTDREMTSMCFPMTEDKINEIMGLGKEYMVDCCEFFPIDGEYGMNLREFNEAVIKLTESGAQEQDLKILSKLYLASEILEGIDKMMIVDFDAETSNWSSADFWSESDKGRVLYEMGIASFPVPVQEELEEYMDYAALWRDAEINLGLRTISTDNGRYIVSLQ